MRRDFFSGASENENVGDFPLKSDRWKDLIGEQQVFEEAPQDENIFAIAPRKNFWLNKKSYI